MNVTLTQREVPTGTGGGPVAETTLRNVITLQLDGGAGISFDGLELHMLIELLKALKEQVK